MLIVLEGSEGAGKSTQIRLLAQWLEREGHAVLSLREPGGTAVGDEIRQILLGHPGSDLGARAESLLFMASRAQLVEMVIGPALAEGKVVLLDRFFLSTYAYQIAGRGLPQDEVIAANGLATEGLRPDLTILLTLPVADGFQRIASRGANDRIEQADAGFHERVSRAFREFATAEWQRAHPEAGPIVSVDGRGSVEQVAELVRSTVQERWPASSAVKTS